MRSSWWRKKSELVPEQIDFINLPPQGRYSLVGPPGSGKTNLLLLRAQFLAGNGDKNALIITFTNSLCDFIRSGIGKSGHISAGQVMTFHSWAGNYIIDQLGVSKKPKGSAFDEATRAEILEKLKEANSKRPSEKMYSAIFVDEAQDLSADELEQLLCLSDKICICGDDKQGIYYQNGLSIAEKLKLEKHELTSHFRIGQRIAQVADRLVPPPEGAAGLAARANYNEKLQGKSTAELHPKDSRDEQFAKMAELIRVQLVAFNDDNIGVFAGTNEAIAELKERFDKTELAGLVAYHGQEGGGSFSSDARIHVMTLHGSKGTEFRAVHIFAAEELYGYPLRRTKLAYTGITRARTALNVFRTGPTSTAIENAFAKPALMDMDALFEEDA
ncbi:superfamily I DNA/RNA helicase [Pseudothauera nasutitermitis]|uniref:DNA 3'-5' helicase II n=1 Tax=Pseudothauera nasutitermitis TaxID=2565930 RepID=A0A4S4B0R6_9RHOO|nr:UvrD-helicase domain-containing protein [Pseudothauera nasutitermitis]THF65622.1 superfamily I DNA/RNA helicase [Pseudothauera nasutitermitis]